METPKSDPAVGQRQEKADILNGFAQAFREVFTPFSYDKHDGPGWAITEIDQAPNGRPMALALNEADAKLIVAALNYLHNSTASKEPFDSIGISRHTMVEGIERELREDPMAYGRKVGP